MNNFKKIMILSLLSVSLLRAEGQPDVNNNIENKTIETPDNNKSGIKKSLETKEKTPDAKTTGNEKDDKTPDAKKPAVKKTEDVKLSKKNEFELNLENLNNKCEVSKFTLKIAELNKSINLKITELKKDEVKNKAAIEKLEKEVKDNNEKITIYSKYEALNNAEIIALKGIKTFDEAKLKTAESNLAKAESAKKALKSDAAALEISKVDIEIAKAKETVELLKTEKTTIETTNKEVLVALKAARDKNKVGITAVIKANLSEIKDYAKNNKLKFGGKLLLAGFTVYGIYKAISSLFEKTQEENDFENNSNYEI